MGKPVNIDSMKSAINTHGGIARGNRYCVYIPHPSKSMNSQFRFDPATALNNMISGDGHNIGDFIRNPNDMFLLCQTCSIPGKRITTTEATHDHNMSKKPYSMMTDEVSMSFLLTNDYYIKKYFDMWQEMIIDSTSDHYKAMYKRDYCSDITIQQLSQSNDLIPGYSVQLVNAYPILLSAIELGEGSDSMLEVSVTWEYDNWRSVSDELDGYVEAAITTIGKYSDTKVLKKLETVRKDRFGHEQPIGEFGPNDEVREQVKGPWNTKGGGPWTKQPVAGGF
jgi:hypothetical protein